MISDSSCILKHEFEVNIMPISNNDMYMPRPYKGGKGAYITKTPALRKFEDTIDPQLGELVTDEFVDKLKSAMENPQLALHLGFSFGMPKTEFYKCDASNYVKSIEDAIKYRLKVDDSRNCSVSSTKYLSNTNYWVTKITIETYELEFEVESKWHSWKE